MNKSEPDDVHRTYMEAINTGNLDSLISLYESDACFVLQPGQIVHGVENIYKIHKNFINMNGKMDTKVKRVIKTKNLALVITDWYFTGTKTDGKHVHLSSTATDVMHKQSDGTWSIIIDNQWGTK